MAILTATGILEARPKVGYFYSGKKGFNLIADYFKNLTVSEIKSRPVVVNEDTSVYDAIVTLFLEDVGTIFVQNNGYLSGVVSRKDFLKIAIGNSDIHKMPIGMIMTRMPNIITIRDDDSVIKAAQKIIEHEVDCLPVVEKVDEKNGKELLRIVGRVSKTNITKLLAQFVE